jgi:hypothetical protein
MKSLCFGLVLCGRIQDLRVKIISSFCNTVFQCLNIKPISCNSQRREGAQRLHLLRTSNVCKDCMYARHKLSGEVTHFIDVQTCHGSLSELFWDKNFRGQVFQFLG